jgi:osmotically-inducible protein OsmY
MAEDRYESREPWDDERRREQERRRMQDRPDYGQADFSTGPRRPASRRPDESDGDRGYRPFGDDGRIYTKSGGYEGDGRAYGRSGRFDELSPAYRDFEANQRRVHRGDYDPQAYAPNPREGRSAESRSWWERTQDELSALFGDEHARRRREWDERQAQAEGEHRGRGPKGYRRSDERIADDINDRLTQDPAIDASEIEVAVRDGEVTLSGTIFRKEDKRRAEDLADRVSGVTHVQNNLRLRRDGDAGVAPAL